MRAAVLSARRQFVTAAPLDLSPIYGECDCCSGTSTCRTDAACHGEGWKAAGSGCGGRRGSRRKEIRSAVLQFTPGRHGRGSRERERRAARSSSASATASGGEEGAISSTAQPAASGGEEGAISSTALPSASMAALGGRTVARKREGGCRPGVEGVLSGAVCPPVPESIREKGRLERRPSSSSTATRTGRRKPRLRPRRLVIHDGTSRVVGGEREGGDGGNGVNEDGDGIGEGKAVFSSTGRETTHDATCTLMRGP
jgi:hypothetical protein